MNTLIIESSTDIELLALSSGRGIFQFSERTGLSHSTGMFVNLESLFDSAGLSIRDIELLGVGTGPGSFTGVRIAVSTARMLSQILQVPLVGVRSHEIYAASSGTDDNETIAVAFDAKKSKVYAGLYIKQGGSTVTLIEPGDFFIQEFFEKIPDTERITCIGDGFAKYRAELEDYSAEKGTAYSFAEDFMPSGEAASLLVLEKFRLSPGLYTDYSGTLPSYERLSDAENAYNLKKK